jgi:hypothetical protein
MCKKECDNKQFCFRKKTWKTLFTDWPPVCTQPKIRRHFLTFAVWFSLQTILSIFYSNNFLDKKKWLLVHWLWFMIYFHHYWSTYIYLYLYPFEKSWHFLVLTSEYFSLVSRYLLPLTKTQIDPKILMTWERVRSKDLFLVYSFSPCKTNSLISTTLKDHWKNKELFSWKRMIIELEYIL